MLSAFFDHPGPPAWSVHARTIASDEAGDERPEDRTDESTGDRSDDPPGHREAVGAAGRDDDLTGDGQARRRLGAVGAQLGELGIEGVDLAEEHLRLVGARARLEGRLEPV